MPGIVSIDRRSEVVGGMSSVEARPWDSSPAVCRCQLIVWGPGQNGDLDVSPDTPQELIPAAYTNVVMEPDGVWEGRFMLLPPNTASQPPAQDWIIEALDRHGRVTSALEFARLNGHSVSWSSQIIGAPTMCEEYLRFQVRRAFNGAVSDPGDPNDHYWIRARRPRTGPEETAVICKVKIRLGAYLPGGYIATPPREDHDTYAAPAEPYRPPRGGEDTYAPPAEQPRPPRGAEPTYAPGIIYLGQVVPPGPEGVNRPLSASALVQAEPPPEEDALDCEIRIDCGRSYAPSVPLVGALLQDQVWENECLVATDSRLLMRMRLIAGENKAKHAWRIYCEDNHVKFSRIGLLDTLKDADGNEYIEGVIAECILPELKSSIEVPCTETVPFVICADKAGEYDIICEWGIVKKSRTVTVKDATCAEQEMQDLPERERRRVQEYRKWKHRKLEQQEREFKESTAADQAADRRSGQRWRIGVLAKRLEPVGKLPRRVIEHVSIYDEADKGQDYFDDQGVLVYHSNFKRDAEALKTASGKDAIVIGVDSIEMLVDKLRKLLSPDVHEGHCACIKNISIHAHGILLPNLIKPGGFRFSIPAPGDPPGSTTTTEQCYGYVGDKEVKARRSAEQLGILFEDAMCPEGVINFMACWAAKGDFLELFGRTANVRVRGTPGFFVTKLEGQGEGKPAVLTWNASEGIREYIPPKEFPRDKDRDSLDFSIWGETKDATGVGEHPQGTPATYREGTALWS